MIVEFKRLNVFFVNANRMVTLRSTCLFQFFICGCWGFRALGRKNRSNGDVSSTDDHIAVLHMTIVLHYDNKQSVVILFYGNALLSSYQ